MMAFAFLNAELRLFRSKLPCMLPSKVIIQKVALLHVQYAMNNFGLTEGFEMVDGTRSRSKNASPAGEAVVEERRLVSIYKMRNALFRRPIRLRQKPEEADHRQRPDQIRETQACSKPKACLEQCKRHHIDFTT